MHFETGATYHVYNRSNETLFKNRDNYLYFLKKVRLQLLPYCDILAYCLMPNHFHFILTVNEEGTLYSTNKKRTDMQRLSEVIASLLSSYTLAFNKQNGRRGSLFAHRTKAKILNDANDDYPLQCFMYVHQNPILSGLVNKIEDWEFSSFQDFIGLRNGTLVNKSLACAIFQIQPDEIYPLTYRLLQDKVDDDYI